MRILVLILMMSILRPAAFGAEWGRGVFAHNSKFKARIRGFLLPTPSVKQLPSELFFTMRGFLDFTDIARVSSVSSFFKISKIEHEWLRKNTVYINSLKVTNNYLDIDINRGSANVMLRISGGSWRSTTMMMKNDDRTYSNLNDRTYFNLNNEEGQRNFTVKVSIYSISEKQASSPVEIMSANDPSNSPDCHSLLEYDLCLKLLDDNKRLKIVDIIRS